MSIPTWLKTAGEFISQGKANSMITQHAKSLSKGKVDSVYFSRDKIEVLLSQPDVVGIRVYMAADEILDGHNTVILKAVDSQGKAIDTRILEVGAPCPPYC